MIYSHANFHIHRATHDNDYVEWEEENEELDYNEIEKSLLTLLIVLMILKTILKEKEQINVRT